MTYHARLEDCICRAIVTVDNPRLYRQLCRTAEVLSRLDWESR